ncbi:hypothetical protein Dimus_016546 [Dionaea muscipula]
MLLPNKIVAIQEELVKEFATPLILLLHKIVVIQEKLVKELEDMTPVIHKIAAIQEELVTPAILLLHNTVAIQEDLVKELENVTPLVIHLLHHHRVESVRVRPVFPLLPHKLFHPNNQAVTPHRVTSWSHENIVFP